MLIVASAAMQVALPWPLKIIVDDVLKVSDKSGRNGLLQAFGIAKLDQWQLLLVAIGGLLFITLCNAAASYLGSRILNGAGERIMASIRGEVFAHLQRLSLSFHDKQQLGDLVTRAKIGRAHV